MRCGDGDRTAVTSAYRSGATLKQIAAECGTNRVLIRRVLVDEGVPIRQRGRTAYVDGDALIEAYRVGASVAQLACEHGVSQQTIRERLYEYGVLSRHKRLNVDVETIRSRRAAGDSLRVIAADVGLSVSTVQRRLRGDGPPVVTELRSPLQTTLAAVWRGRLPDEPPRGVSERNWTIFLRIVAGEYHVTVARDLGITRARVGQIIHRVADILSVGDG